MTNNSPSPECPKWAADLLEKLQRIEVKLGNIQEVGDTTSDGWRTRALNDLMAANEAAASGESGDSDDHHDNAPLSGDDGAADVAEAIFARVGAGLLEDGFDANQIAAIINSKVGSKAVRLKYCDANDVNEALKA